MIQKGRPSPKLLTPFQMPRNRSSRTCLVNFEAVAQGLRILAHRDQQRKQKNIAKSFDVNLQSSQKNHGSADNRVASVDNEATVSMPDLMRPILALIHFSKTQCDFLLYFGEMSAIARQSSIQLLRSGYHRDWPLLEPSIRGI